ncbi:MAG: radical SAM protein, partial [Deltaproteobacteria bacterium]|nr:radical SAM protein [Deltaproteobacteria bacterium]
NIFVTNGYMTEECLGTLKGLLHAANVDVKSFNDKTYKKVCGARLEPVLKSVERMRDMGIWVEVTTLIIPTINDSEEELREIAKWVASIDPGMPWHVSAFYPAYKMMDLPPTDPKTVERAREIGLSEGLRYVYTGNIRHGSGENTVCHSCDELLIERSGYAILANNIENRACPKCKSPTNGVWE